MPIAKTKVLAAEAKDKLVKKFKEQIEKNGLKFKDSVINELLENKGKICYINTSISEIIDLDIELDDISQRREPGEDIFVPECANISRETSSVKNVIDLVNGYKQIDGNGERRLFQSSSNNPIANEGQPNIPAMGKRYIVKQ